LFSCREDIEPIITNAPGIGISSNDPALHLVNGTWFYKDKVPFSGAIKDLYPGGTVKSLLRLEHGKEQGYTETWYNDSRPESRRWYSNGEKDGLHKGWWPNGNKKFEYHFTNGNYNGLFTEWYQSGKMLQQVVYDNGNEVSGKGWRENGKLYMSFVMKDGRRYGLFNANLCYSVTE